MAVEQCVVFFDGIRQFSTIKNRLCFELTNFFPAEDGPPPPNIQYRFDSPKVAKASTAVVGRTPLAWWRVLVGSRPFAGLSQWTHVTESGSRSCYKSGFIMGWS